LWHETDLTTIDSNVSAVGGSADIVPSRASEAPSCSKKLLFAYRHNVGRSLWPTICSPCFHKFATLFENIASAVGLFGLVANDMSKRRLGDFTGEVGDVPRLIPEAGAKAVNGGVFAASKAANAPRPSKSSQKI
jgi:hypothetical protein